MTKTQQLEKFMEAVSLQQNLDQLLTKRNNLWTKYLSARTTKEGTKFLNTRLKVCEIIDQVNSDLFSILA